MPRAIETRPYTSEPNNVSVQYQVKWYVPQLAEWIVVGIERTEERALEIETHFQAKLRKNWTGNIQTAVIQITEVEVNV